MTKNEVKKIIYKQKPPAIFNKIKSGILYYDTCVELEPYADGTDFEFEIPIEEIGDTEFLMTMDACLLLRWLKVWIKT